MNDLTQAPSSGRPFIHADNITVQINERLFLNNTTWIMNTCQRWAIAGPNGSGKSIFIQALCRKLPIVQGQIHYFFKAGEVNHPLSCSYPKKGEIVVISTDTHQAFMKKYTTYHQARWQSFEGLDVPTVSDLLTIENIEHPSPYDNPQIYLDEEPYQGKRRYIIELLGIDYLLKRKIHHLSHGESRKVHIARAWIQSPRLMILDDPYVGLDHDSCETLKHTIENILVAETPNLLFVTPRLDEIPRGITHILYLENNRIVARGEKSTVLSQRSGKRYAIKNLPPISHLSPKAPVSRPETAPFLLIALKDVTIAYDDVKVLQHINWEMKIHEHWAILGPNGSGKTTLLSLILADNPQSYANDITLFGKKRGSGESIWDIKQRIGFVSPELQIYYHPANTCLQVVCSGFFNSIGLYRNCSLEQLDIASNWMKSLGIEYLFDRLFCQVSAGEQRLVLLTRALVKQPELLVLDEPCQELDAEYSHHFLQCLEHLCQTSPIYLIMTTHNLENIPRIITHVLKLNRGQIEESGTRQQVLA